MRGFDLARNPGLNNNTEYGAGEFPLPIRPSARSAGQSTSKIPSMMRAQKKEKRIPSRETRPCSKGTLDEDAWRELLSDFNREVDGEITLDDFKEELWDTVVKF